MTLSIRVSLLAILLAVPIRAQAGFWDDLTGKGKEWQAWGDQAQGVSGSAAKAAGAGLEWLGGLFGGGSKGAPEPSEAALPGGREGGDRSLGWKAPAVEAVAGGGLPGKEPAPKKWFSGIDWVKPEAVPAVLSAAAKAGIGEKAALPPGQGKSFFSALVGAKKGVAGLGGGLPGGFGAVKGNACEDAGCMGSSGGKAALKAKLGASVAAGIAARKPDGKSKEGKDAPAAAEAMSLLASLGPKALNLSKEVLGRVKRTLNDLDPERRKLIDTFESRIRTNGASDEAVENLKALERDMLSDVDKYVLRRLVEQNHQVVIWPDGKKLTDTPEFKGRAGTEISKGNLWDDVEGVANVRTPDGKGYYIAVPENNLLRETGFPKGQVFVHELNHAVHRALPEDPAPKGLKARWEYAVREGEVAAGQGEGFLEQAGNAVVRGVAFTKALLGVDLPPEGVVSKRELDELFAEKKGKMGLREYGDKNAWEALSVSSEYYFGVAYYGSDAEVLKKKNPEYHEVLGKVYGDARELRSLIYSKEELEAFEKVREARERAEAASNGGGKKPVPKQVPSHVHVP